MRYLHSAFTCWLTPQSILAMGGWLTLRNYPFAVDIERCKLIAFNLPLQKMAKLVKRYKPFSYTIEVEPRPTLLNEELYRFMEKAIGDGCTKAAEYDRHNYHGTSVNVPTRHDLSRRAFDDTYSNAFDARFRICLGLYNLDANNPDKRVDYNELPNSTAILRDDVIKNHLILSFRQLPELKLGESVLGAEAWAYDKEGKQIIAF